MFCPNSRTRRNEMNLGERKTQMSSAAVPPMRTSPMELGVVAAAEGVSGDGDVVEGLLAPVGELLALLVALARDDDDVAGPGEGDRVGDRAPPVHLHAHVAALDAGHDLGDDRLGVLGARGVAG